MEATEQLQEKREELQNRLGTQLEEAKRNLQDLNARITEFVRQRPGVCLLGALAFGFVVGRIASRR
jgi:ElaB/YqjD/DUF883 family membrane-anchored ribosome-binding protein